MFIVSFQKRRSYISFSKYLFYIVIIKKIQIVKLLQQNILRLLKEEINESDHITKQIIIGGFYAIRA